MCCITNLRKSHSLWDRAKREWQGVIRKSAQCENTKGTKIETDLRNLVTTCDEVDASCMGVENTCLASGSLSDGQIAEAAVFSASLVEAMKDGSKKASALKPLFKV